MKLDQDFLNSVKSAVDIIDIVGEHVVLRKAGSNHTGLCPFHAEKSPSFSVSQKKQLYHCYGCKKGGDLFSFFMEIHGLSFPEAVVDLADRAGVKVPGKLKSQVHSSDNSLLKQAFRLNLFVAQFFKQSLKDRTILKYLSDRNVDQDLMKEFYIGFAPNSWEALENRLRSAKAPLKLAEQLGLLRPSTKPGSEYFDLFRNRVIFPISDLRGRIVGFSGRLMNPGPNEPKYLNSPDSMAYKKSKTLYGLFQAKRNIRELDEVIVVEGQFDVLALHRVGIKNAVAPCGTSLTQQHLQILMRLTKNIVIAFDGDRAGISAAERAMELGLNEGLVLKGLSLPEGKDPSDVLKAAGSVDSGREELSRIFANSKPILDERIEDLALETDRKKDTETRATSLKQIAKWLQMFKDPIGRDLRMEAVRKRFDVSNELIRKAVGVSPETKPRGQQTPTRQPAPRRPLRPRLRELDEVDRILLSGLLWWEQYAETWARCRAELPPGLDPETGLSELFYSEDLQVFFREILKNPERLDGLRNDPHLFLNYVQDPQVRSTISKICLQSESGVKAIDFARAVQQALLRKWARYSHDIGSTLASADSERNSELHVKLSKEFLDVQRKMKELNKFI